VEDIEKDNGASELDGTDAELAALEDDSFDYDADESLENEVGEPIPAGVPVYALFLAYSHETLYGIYRGGVVPAGAQVVLRTRYGMDIVQVRGELKRAVSPQKILRIERIADEDDLRKAKKYREKEAEAFPLCKERIDFHKLEMKLISVHYLHEDQKIMFFFSAENRIDFRLLVKDLVGIFRCRIELRQISARDESRMGGGFGICGRCYCCSTITDKLKPVSIKMAKEQNLSLNTAKISGPCGRLLCCLAYEHSFYCAERHSMPSEGCRILHEGEVWKVREVNPICSSVTLCAEDGRQMQAASNRFAKVDNKWHIDKVSASRGAGNNKGAGSEAGGEDNDGNKAGYGGGKRDD
jgi:cell fate regulator YaaT (PSP1 superfamily)